MGWLIGIALALVVNLIWIRPWQIRWGATDEEVARRTEGDAIVPRPNFSATRAVTVRASPEAIYPWILQIGFGRAGWYSYDWVDNLGRPSAGRIIPELQEVKVGDLVPLYTDVGFFVEAMEPPGRAGHPSWILWVDKERNSSWYWGLYPAPNGTTRLITRVRLRYRWLSPTILFSLMLDLGDIIMMRKCMLGIKQRAEAKSGPPPARP